MRIKRWAIIPLIGLIAFFLFSCNRNYVSLDYTNAKGEVPQLENLVFRFDKSLIPDSLVNNWDSTNYISFSPSIPGKFRWNSTDEIVFSPSGPLLPATSYTAKISDAILHYSKFNDIRNMDKIEFHTPNLQLTDAQVTWVAMDESVKVPTPQIHVEFNYPVKLDDVREKLSVMVEGNNVDYKIMNTGTSNEFNLRLNSFKGEDKNYEAQLIIQKGLKPDKGEKSTDNDLKTLITIPSPYTLNINNVETEHDGEEGTIRIYTSQQLTADNIASYIKFTPDVKFTVELTDMGFQLHSDKFDASANYSFTIKHGLHGNIGGVLKEDYYGNAVFGELASEIKFMNNKAVYLSKQGNGNVEVRITNTPKVKIIISKIYENNLLMAGKFGYQPADDENRSNEPEYASYEENDEGYSGISGDASSGDVIYTKEIDTRTLPKSGNGRILNLLQFEDRLSDFKGIYHIMIRSAKDYWIRDSRFISLSDIGLIAKQGDDKMVVFANSIKTAMPLNGVTVNVYGVNNQLIGTAATGSDGVAQIQVSNKSYQGFKPAMIIAKTANDFNYLPFTNTRVNTSRFDVGGKRNNVAGLDAFIYAERDIYRPGEKVNFSVLIRDKNWKVPGELPLKMKFLLPTGKELKSLRKTVNEQGALDGSFDISSSAITGNYSLEVYSSNDVLLGTKSFMIEEFVPDRIKVAAKLDKTFLTPSESAALQINATNFFGPPAANRNYEIEIQVHQKEFSSSKYSDYEFSLANQKEFHDQDVKEGHTDEDGKATINYTVPAMYANTGLLETSFYTTVFDETGRPVSRKTTTPVYTQNVFNGIKDDGYYYYSLNQPVRFQLISLNKDDRPVTANAVVQVIKHEYKTVLVKEGSFFRYDSQVQDIIMSDQQISVTVNTPYVYTPHSPGDYELRIYRPGANAYVSKRFYSYGNWGNGNSSFKVNTEGHIDIQMDKQEYNSNENAKVLFKAPFSGRMLVTLETDHLISYKYVDVQQRTASMEINLNGECVPNVYITATLIKPHEVSDIPLTVAHGFQNITVVEKTRKIHMEILSPSLVRSKTHQSVKVKAIPGSYVTLAAVDNGVLQITNFKTPDPYSFYYQKKALQVYAFDMYPLLFPELRARLSSTGGDGEVNQEKRVNPMPAKRFKIMSYWSGLKKANGDGIAEFEFDVPQFSGEIRLMAAAFKDESFGSAENSTRVADPIVLSTSLPRFISPGDTVEIPVTITNTSMKSANGKATIGITGPLKIIGNTSESVSINSQSEGKVNFKVIANPTISVANIKINVNTLGENFSDETEISIRPPSTLQKVSGSGSILAGSSQTISIPQGDFMPESFKYELIVGHSPITMIADQLRYLLQYPYGCTEQTVSSAFPQLYFGDFADAMKMHNDERKVASFNIQEAIRKIKMRQLYSGAVTLWDNEGTEDWWATIYAAHFLLEAKKAGYDVDNSLLETMLSYLANKLKTRQTINYYYNRNLQKKIAPKEVAYSLYVLSIAGRSQASSMNYYKANTDILALDSKYLLSAAFAASGDKRSFIAMLPASFSGEESIQQTGGSYYSALRDESIALNCLIDVDPGNAQIPVMAKHVAERLKAERWINTQESAFSFLALGKIARASSPSKVSGEIKVNGSSIAEVNKTDWKGTNRTLKSNTVQIEAKGEGRLYYSWVAEGISTTGSYKEEDNFIKVRRQFLDRFGKPLNTTSFKQNQLIIVELTLEKAFDGPIDNIVLTDLLPAGFEIENPRTKEIPGMDWIKDASDPTAMDIRDDRINLFVDLNKSKQKYYYAVRAVSTGQFKQGPVSADAMYKGEIHSYHGAQTIKITN